MSPSAADHLRHILDEIDYLTAAAAGVERSQFLADPTLRRAFARSLEVIGEAAKQIPDAVRVTLPEVEWRGMTGMRDRLIHGYFGVDYELVWDVVEAKIPALRSQVVDALFRMGRDAADSSHSPTGC